jgi:hypothetical protein
VVSLIWPPKVIGLKASEYNYIYYNSLALINVSIFQLG